MRCNLEYKDEDFKTLSLAKLKELRDGGDLSDSQKYWCEDAIKEIEAYGEKNTGESVQEEALQGGVKIQAIDSNTTNVKIVDIDIPFFSLVAYMVKFGLASIPAVLILSAVLNVFVKLFK
jgi:hypothetical protein